jgi:archaemetzincin
MRALGLLLGLLLALALPGCQRAQTRKAAGPCPADAQAWQQARRQAGQDTSAQGYAPCLDRALGHLHLPPPTPGHNDWLAKHDEPGQPFRKYAQAHAGRADSLRRTVYLCKIGPFQPSEARLLDSVAVYLATFFQQPVQWLPDVPLQGIPPEAQRLNPHRGHPQLQALYLLRRVLAPALPPDASVCLGFTAQDLYPAEGWNYVFGQASLRERVGVWSIYRFGRLEPGAGPNDDAFRKCLLRTAKTATHETGHAYSIEHCLDYQCNMAGSNHLEELDRQPIWYCPTCLAKICWRLEVGEEARFAALERFWKRQGMKAEASFYRKSRRALQGR